jgi:hypothetical protein
MKKLRTLLKAGGWLVGIYIAQALIGFVGGVAITAYAMFS